MDLLTTYQILLNEKPDYAKPFKKVYENIRRNNDDSFQEYVELISRNPVDWLESFPDQFKAESTFIKAKSAICYLLKHQDIVNEDNKELFCNTEKLLNNACKTHVKQIVEARCKYDNSVVDEARSCASVAEDPPIHLRVLSDKLIHEQEKYCLMMENMTCKNTIDSLQHKLTSLQSTHSKLVELCNEMLQEHPQKKLFEKMMHLIL